MTQKRIVISKVIVWLLCLAPIANLVLHGMRAELGANPIEKVMNSLGYWTLTLLVSSLAITPLRRISGWNWMIRFRRLVGLFAFFYVCLHLATYVVLDQELDLAAVLQDIPKRPFILVGFLAFMLLAPLAATSTQWSIRKLGGRNWNRLHKLVYVSAALGVVHFWWKVKADKLQPAIFGAVLALLLGYRIVAWLRNRAKAPAGAASAVVRP
ncbi:MAG TPA: protein-methionine-sulfoxide reductase heme-binding subunit MsrQ [Terriglobales bacterium]|nr:protein-methionine-sulfoxide reductase heme-binding subunit MsrQ [Terriglobales bacterium]